MKLLATRLRSDWPDDALYVFGKKEPSKIQNELMLDRLPGEPETMKATVMHDFIERQIIVSIFKGSYFAIFLQK